MTTPQVLLAAKRQKRAPQKVDVGTKDELLSLLACDIIQQVFLQARGNRNSEVLTRNDLRSIHGFMLWCLCSKSGHQVSYHIDYAEVLRHQTGIITPPIYGAVVHCSDFGDERMEGGNFIVNARGLDHYKEWGYKAKFKRAACGCNGAFDEIEAAQTEEGWTEISYETNRVVMFDGDFPHAATPIKSIPSTAQRVILGINVLGHNCGPDAARFPDHSARSNSVLSRCDAGVFKAGEHDWRDRESERDTGKGAGGEIVNADHSLCFIRSAAFISHCKHQKHEMPDLNVESCIVIIYL